MKKNSRYILAAATAVVFIATPVTVMAEKMTDGSGMRTEPARKSAKIKRTEICSDIEGKLVCGRNYSNDKMRNGIEEWQEDKAKENVNQKADPGSKPI